jgi:hypothetical protein
VAGPLAMFGESRRFTSLGNFIDNIKKGRECRKKSLSESLKSRRFGHNEALEPCSDSSLHHFGVC